MLHVFHVSMQLSAVFNLEVDHYDTGILTLEVELPSSFLRFTSAEKIIQIYSNNNCFISKEELTRNSSASHLDLDRRLRACASLSCCWTYFHHSNGLSRYSSLLCSKELTPRIYLPAVIDNQLVFWILFNSRALSNHSRKAYPVNSVFLHVLLFFFLLAPLLFVLN